MGVIIGAIGITSSPLSTQDGGTSDRSLKAAPPKAVYRGD
jgi:hypothetical protein